MKPINITIIIIPHIKWLLVSFHFANDYGVGDWAFDILGYLFLLEEENWATILKPCFFNASSITRLKTAT